MRWYGGRDGYRPADRDDVRVLDAAPDRVLLEVDGVGHRFATSVHVPPGGRPDAPQVEVESALGHVTLRRVPRFVDPADQVATGSLLAPMPGTVVGVAVEPGQRVSAGQPVLVLEAMKMQHTVAAPHDGVVTDLPVRTGEQVAAGAVLAVVQEEAAEPATSNGAQA